MEDNKPSNYNIIDIGFSAICAGFIYGTYQEITKGSSGSLLDNILIMGWALIKYGALFAVIQIAILSIYSAYVIKFKNPKSLLILLFFGCLIWGLICKM